MLAINPLRVEVDVSPVYELVLQICAFTGKPELSTYDVGPRWGTTQRSRSSPKLQRAMQRLGGRYAFWEQLIGYQAVERAESVPAFLALLARTEPHEIFLHMAGAYAASLDPSLRSAIAAAVEGSARARAAIPKLLPSDEAEHGDVLRRLLNTPAETVKSLVLETLGTWYERHFSKDETTITELLEDDAAARRALLTTDPERLILMVTGVRYLSRPNVDGVVLIPTVIMRPWLAVIEYQRLHIYCYPVLDDPAIPESVPYTLVRMYQALADPARLRILKALGTDALSLDELAGRLEEEPERLRPHLARLRVGRLIQLNCDGMVTTYERRSDLMRTVAQPLKSYLQITAIS